MLDANVNNLELMRKEELVEILTKMIFRCKIRKILGRETVWKNM